MYSISEQIRSKRDKILSRFVTTILGHIKGSVASMDAARGVKGEEQAYAAHKLRVVRSVSALKVGVPVFCPCSLCSRYSVGHSVAGSVELRLPCVWLGCRCPASSQDFLDAFTRPALGQGSDLGVRKDSQSRTVTFRVTLHLTEIPASVTVSVPQGAFFGHLRQAVADAANVVTNELDLYIYTFGDKAANGVPPGVLLDSDTKCVGVQQPSPPLP